MTKQAPKLSSGNPPDDSANLPSKDQYRMVGNTTKPANPQPRSTPRTSTARRPTRSHAIYSREFWSKDRSE